MAAGVEVDVGGVVGVGAVVGAAVGVELLVVPPQATSSAATRSKLHKAGGVQPEMFFFRMIHFLFLSYWRPGLSILPLYMPGNEFVCLEHAIFSCIVRTGGTHDVLHNPGMFTPACCTLLLGGLREAHSQQATGMR